MTNSLGTYLGKEKLKELFPSEMMNQLKVFRFDILPVSDNAELLSVTLKFTDKSQIEFLLTKKVAMTLGATLLNRAKAIEKVGE